MEKRALLAFMLCALVMMLFFQFTSPAQPPAEKQTSEEETASEQTETLTTSESQPKEKPETPESEKPAEMQKPAPAFKPLETEVRSDVVGDTNLLRAAFINRGGRLKSLRFKKFFTKPGKQITNDDFNGRDESDPADWLEVINGIEDDKYALTLANLAGAVDLEKALFKHVPSDDPKEIVFEYLTPDGLRFIKTFTLRDDVYAMGVTIQVQNESPDEKKLQIQLTGAAGMDPESTISSDIEGLIAKGSPERPELTEESPKTLQTKTFVADEDVLWAGISNSYFAAILLPKREGDEKIVAVLEPLVENVVDPDDARAIASLKYPETTLETGGEESYELDFYVGPRDYSFTEGFEEQGLQAVVDYDTGTFAFILKPIAWLLKLFYGIVRNYGIAIVLLTVLVRLMLHPLTKKQQVSMHHMSKMKPQMDKLRQKYKSDKQKLNTEMMTLYKDQGINPLAGCLPLLLQMPILFGLFSVLRLFPGFRHAVFIPGIFLDLSAADHILKLPFEDFSLPLVGTLQYLNILPILMTVLWFIQQKKMPKSEDPQMAQQQKMMSYMVIMFGIFLYNYQSGLALYMITSTGIGIGEQKYIRNHIREIDERTDEKKRQKDVVKNKGVTVKKASGKRKPA